MLTVLSEIECTLNNRPLTFLYEQPGDIPLTSNHLLFGRTLDSTQSELSTDSLEDRDILNYSQRIKDCLEHFWKRWKSEYLVELREHQKQTLSKGYDVIKLDDPVIIEDDKIKQRGMWKVGIVTEIIPSKDGQMRGARVKYRLNGKDRTVNRPVNKLYPLEIRDYEDDVKIQFVNEDIVDTLIAD